MARTRSTVQSITSYESAQRKKSLDAYTILKVRHLHRLYASRIIAKYLYKHFIKPRRAQKWRQNSLYQVTLIN
jgi:hypothetical protein